MQAPPPDVETLAADLLRAAKTHRVCTGGYIAALLTDVEGLSHIFERGYVCYCDAAKHEYLAVPAAILEGAGAVSEAAARAMALGALSKSGAGLALAITGYAGASAPDEEPGLVHIAAARRARPVLHLCRRYGPQSRDVTRQAAARDALQLTLQSLT